MRRTVLVLLGLALAFGLTLGWGAVSSARQQGVAPVGSPVRCLALAVVLTASEEDSVRMGNGLLAMAQSNGASEADMAGTRTRVQAAERRLTVIRAVRVHFAAAAMDRPTVDYLNNQPMSALYAELDQCAARTSAAPTQSRVVNGFLREGGLDRAGNDLGMVEVRTDDFEACRALCAANSQCRAFNLYTPPPRDKSYCWLKHTAGPTRVDPNSVGGVRQ